MSYLTPLPFEEIYRITPAKYKKKRTRPALNVGFLSSSNWKTLSLYLLLISVAATLLIKTFSLQVVNGAENQELSEGNSVRSTLLKPERGVIFDRNKNIIVRNRPAFSIELSMSECEPRCDSVINEVAQLVKVDVAEISEKVGKGETEITLAQGLERDDILKVENRIRFLPGVNTSVDPLRDYLSGESFAHLVGFIGNSKEGEKVGIAGVEKQYENYLHGVPGSRLLQVDSTGTRFTQVAEKLPRPGKNIQLYADKNLQDVAYTLLKEAVEQKKALGGAVVALDPKTGGVLAMVSYPSFDSNLFAKGISQKDYGVLVNDPRKPFFNRAISAVYPPGSTFKMVTALAALDNNVIKEESLVPCPPYINNSGFIFRDWYSGGRGLIDVKKALQVSCDTFFYTVGGGYGDYRGVGIQPIADWAKKLYFGQKLGIDMEGESAGVFPDPEWKKTISDEPWYIGETYNTSIGQGNILATPLQLTNMTVFFANKGKIFKPRLVKYIAGEEDEVPQVMLEDRSQEKNIDIIREGMKLAVSPGGTAFPLFDFTDRHPGIVLAGKTGTAEFGNPVEVGEAGHKTHAWFTVFGPFDDPNIALTVFLEGGGAGSDDASPIARRILDEWFKK